MPRYGIAVTTTATFEQAIERVREAFAAQGFGVVTEMNVQATLASKIGEDIGPYVVLGMCNPRFASRAIAGDPDIGVLLPCNVLIAGGDGPVRVVAQDPALMVEATGNSELRPIADEVRGRIVAALESVAAS